MSLLLIILAILAVGAGLVWFIDYANIPHPLGMLLKVLIVVLVVFAILAKSGLLTGTGLG